MAKEKKTTNVRKFYQVTVSVPEYLWTRKQRSDDEATSRELRILASNFEKALVAATTNLKINEEIESVRLQDAGDADYIIAD